MSKRLYTNSHEWLEVKDNIATVGITDYAQHALGDVVYVEVPESGKTITAGSPVAVVESVKAASEVYAPVSGTVTESNTAIQTDPSLVNRAANSDGWFFRLKINNPNELEKLLTEDSYKSLILNLS
ncbi:MAG: glycine cleavage system protein GcvH [Holosporales bacterium]|jgi:glycine cleavage system H protein